MTKSEYWQQTRRLTCRLLGLWVVLILGAVLLVPFFDITVYGMPFTYWAISSVLLLSFLGIVSYYAWRMDRLDSTYKNTQDRQG